MILITGGAYQGKTAWAAENHKIQSFWDCAEKGFPARADCILHMESFSKLCAEKGISSVEWLKENEDIWQNSILICRQIGSGVVPVLAKDRKWVEENGAMLRFLSKEAKKVFRIFAGLAEDLK
ncbi:MAG: bifunctional adenosylcobinamide kinase/adenosylcobinamide-phosphate guanylyltransferase [Firmicutes bacterium]|nr:bifunctional adenosylcobinamide kinase/adenosylcobinamide-phosphate guanylyltransferase [Bacillota bacterium]